MTEDEVVPIQPTDPEDLPTMQEDGQVMIGDNRVEANAQLYANYS